MAFPATALVAFGVYASVMYWYAVPGAGYMPAGPVDVPAWIGELSLALPVTATVLYLSMCAFGPKLMAKREAFDPKGFMLVYNGYQTVFNVVTVAIFIAELNRVGVKAWGGRLSWSNPESFWICTAIWLHYNNKYLELLDTVFMVLRKKNAQLSFLHVYHHCLLIWAWWMVCFVIKNNDCIDAYLRVHERGHPRHHVLVLPDGRAEDPVPVEEVHYAGADGAVRDRLRARLLRDRRRALPQDPSLLADVAS